MSVRSPRLLQQPAASFLLLLCMASTALGEETPNGSSRDVALSATVNDAYGFLEWTTAVDHEGISLAVADPYAQVRTFSFTAGEAPVFSLVDARGVPLADGTYTWELRLIPRRGANPGGSLVQSGYFTIAEGGVVSNDLIEPPEGRRQRGSSPGLRSTTAADQIVPDDFVVDGKGCIGLGCVNNEPFGTEALRLKQSVVRLRLEDTSTAGGFPARDWQLTVNDSASGGADRFSIDDLTAGTTPLTIRGGAPSSSFYVDGVGNIGLGTATPAQDLHVASGSTPTVRFDQTGGTVRTWDVGASNANFFVKDVTNASAIPLRINSGAPTNSLHLASNGFIGLGTATPLTQLHVTGSDPSGASNKILVRSTGPFACREMFEIINNGCAAFVFKDATVPERWTFGTTGGHFAMDNQAASGVEFVYGPTGSLTITGNLTAANFPSSSRTLKENFGAVDPAAILEKIAAMPVTEWSFKEDPEHQRHIGPTVEDFQAAFGLGTNGQSLVVTDVSGVALVAIQALHAQLQQQRLEIVELQREIERLNSERRR
jgi:hypothetical protein